MRPSYLVAISLLSASSAAHGQASRPAYDNGRLSLAVYLGSFSGGPSRDLAASMKAAGYTDPFGGCSFLICVPESPSPSAYSHANPLLLSIRYRVLSQSGLELLFGQSASGMVSGNRRGEHLNIEYGGTVVAPVATVGGRRLYGGLGPALLRGHWTYQNSADGSESRESTITLGWIGTGTVVLPIGRVFQAHGTGQYRGFGDARVRHGPAGGSHWYVAGGVGISL